MTLSDSALLASLGSLAGFVSGLLGIGGGILMVPLLLYLPPWLGLSPLDMKTVAGITMVQSLSASLAGTLGHGRRRSVHVRLVAFMGGATAVGALAGGLASYWLSGTFLKILFAGLALAAGILLFFPVRDAGEDLPTLPPFSRALASASGLAIGLLGGLVGQGGGFMIVPGLIYLLHIPTRLAVGSSLAIGLLSGTAGLAGKLVTAQVPLWPSVAVVTGALAGSFGGSSLSQRLSQATLRRALALVIIAVALRITWEMVPLPQETTPAVQQQEYRPDNGGRW